MKYKTGFMTLDELDGYDFKDCFIWHDIQGKFVYVLTECTNQNGDTIVLPGKMYFVCKKIFLPDKLFLEGEFVPKSWKPIGWCYPLNQ